MKSRLADAALGRLSNTVADEPVMAEDEVLRVLSRIARTGKASDRLRAAELLGKHLGMFRENDQAQPRITLADLVPKSKFLRESPATDAELVDEENEGGEEP